MLNLSSTLTHWGIIQEEEITVVVYRLPRSALTKIAVHIQGNEHQGSVCF
jgi:hypothetical protein